MDEIILQISAIERKIESNNKMRSKLKAVSGCLVFVIFIFSLFSSEIINVAWIISLAVIVIMFFLDLSCVKNNKQCEFELYEAEVENLRHKRELAKILHTPLPDYMLTRVIEKPSEVISPSIAYYAIVLLLDVLVKIFFCFSKV